MGPTPAAEELFLELLRHGNALAAAGLTDDGSTLSEFFLDKRRAALNQLFGGGGGCGPPPLLSPAPAPRAAPQAPTSPWQHAVPVKSPPASLRNVPPPPLDGPVPLAQPGSSDAVRCKSPPAWLRNVPPPPPDGPVPLAQPGSSPPPPPPPGQPLLEKAPPTKAPQPPLPADAIPRREALASAHARWLRAARLDYPGQVLRRQGWLRSIHTSGYGLPERVPATHVNEVEEDD